MQKFDRGLSDLLHSELHWLESISVFSISSESQFIGDSRIVLPSSTWWTAACVWRFQSSSPTVSQPESAGCATTPSQQVWTSIILRCSSDGLEVVSILPLGPSAEHRHFQISIKLTCSWCNGTRSPLEAMRNALYKSTATTTTTGCLILL